MEISLKRLKQKEQATFEYIFNQYKNLIFYQCMSILNNKEDAEDVLQDTFVEFFNKVDEYDSNMNIKITLLSIAKYRSLDLYRKKSKEPIVPIEEMDIYGEDDDSTVSLIMTLNHVLSKLEADVVTKKIIYNFTFKEIAETTFKSLGEIEASYYKAIAKLKKYYKEKKLHD